MGLLKKLAGLVVEFPDEEPAKESGTTAAAGDDVVAAIEQIRMDLEGTSHADFSDTTDKGETIMREQKPAPRPKPAAAVPSTPDSIALPGILSIEEVYTRAKLPTDGFTIYKVEEMLNDPEVSDLAAEMRARMVKLTLKNMGVELPDILKDAGRRDHALEEYGRFLTENIARVEVETAQLNASIQAEMDDFVAMRKAEISVNSEKLARLKDQFAEYQRSKQAEEQRLFQIAAPLVEEGQNPVELES